MTFQQLTDTEVGAYEKISSLVKSPWEGSGLTEAQYIERLTKELLEIDIHGQSDLTKVKSAMSDAVNVILYTQLRLELKKASMMIEAISRQGSSYGRGQTTTEGTAQGAISEE